MFYYGLVSAAVPKFQFVRLCADGKTQDLMPHANPKDRDLSQETLNRFHGIGGSRGIARTIGKENTVGFPS